jgi:hypothetical protein
MRGSRVLILLAKRHLVGQNERLVLVQANSGKWSRGNDLETAGEVFEYLQTLTVATAPSCAIVRTLVPVLALWSGWVRAGAFKGQVRRSVAQGGLADDPSIESPAGP